MAGLIVGLMFFCLSYYYFFNSGFSAFCSMVFRVLLFFDSVIILMVNPNWL